jgi:transposase
MAVADRHGLPIAVWIAGGERAESTLVTDTVETGFTEDPPPRLIGHRAYDSDGLDIQLAEDYGIDLIAPNRRTRYRNQDGRKLPRYRRRWKVERLFAWLFRFRRLVTRWEQKSLNFLGFLWLGCLSILLQSF